MSTIDDLINRSVATMAEYKRNYNALITFAKDENRSNLSADEQNRCEALLRSFADEKDKLERYRAVKADESRIDADLAQPTVPSAVASVRSSESRMATVQVGREAHTYSRETDPYGKQFFADVIAQFRSNDVRANERLGRHINEVERDYPGLTTRSSAGVGTGAFSGLTVPQYLVDMVAPSVVNSRPFADKMNKHPLPAQGMSVNISRITTGSTVALQVSELNAVSFNDMDDTLLTLPVLTAAGQQLVSRQAIERGAGVEDVVLSDLMKRYNTVVDNTVLNAATTGLHTVANVNAYTDATPTGPELYPLVVGAVSQSATATRGQAKPDFALMHPRRWYWLQSQMVATWPMFGSNVGIDPRNAGLNNNQAYDGPAWDGKLPCGVNVCIDANVATDAMGDSSNWDEIFVGSTEEAHLWEDANAPVFIRAEQPSVANLGVNLVVYGYFAFTFQRYSNAFQNVRGTGTLAPPGF